MMAREGRESHVLYRILIGMIPTVLIALFVSGAIPISSVLPSAGYHSSIDEKSKDARGGRNLPEAAVTPGQVTQVFRGVDASLDEEIKRRAPEERRRKERLRRLHQEQALARRGIDGAEWQPESSGWGRTTR